MRNPLRFPIRLKILIALLLVVTGVVSAITFTMANLFHDDKRAYVNNLASMMATNLAEESRSILAGYEERLHTYARLTHEVAIDSRARNALVSGFFVDFPELVAISVGVEGDAAVDSAHDSISLESARLTKADLQPALERRPYPAARLLAGEAFVENSTLTPELLTMTLVTAQPASGGGPPWVVAAVIRLDALMRAASRARSFETFLADPSGRLLAHVEPERVARREVVRLQVDPNDASWQHNSSLTREYVANGEEMIGGFAGVSFGSLIAGAQIPQSAAYLASRDLLGSLVTAALSLLVGAALVGLLWAHRLTRPIERLSQATREIGRGDFEVEVAVESRDEIGALARSFNEMATELREREAALQRAQSQLIQSEKMAAFGQLGAGIAHEVKNPLAGILGCAQLALRKAEKGSSAERNLQLIEKETRRCKAIIENLLSFARQERAAMRPIELPPVIEDTIAICAHQLAMNHVELEQRIAPELPRVHGNANQLQQVVMNLVMNAQQALDGKPGRVTVAAETNRDGLVEIAVSDSGPGVPPEHRSKVFEPFFTTKPGGKGTGLGLSVSFGIIKDHGGEIAVDDAPGGGARFTITLPVLTTHARQVVAVEESESAEC